MALTEYMCLDSGEIANNARVQAYARKLGVTSIRCLCPSLAENTGGPFVDPATDGAPWYDAAVPASAEFCGVFLATVTGLDTEPQGVAVTTLPTGYGSAGQRLPEPRVIGVTTSLIAGSERGLNYGLQWLESQLTAESCAPACLGNSLQFFAHCEDTVPMTRRYLYDVELTDGPDVTTRKALPRCVNGAWFATTEFTITASNPWIYLERQKTYTEQFAGEAVSGCDVKWYEVDQGCPPGADCGGGGLDDFLSDPACAEAPPTPSYATESDSCGCLTRYVSAGNTIALRNEADSAEPVADWVRQVPLVEIDTGDAEMRRLTLRFFQRDSVDTDCADVVANLCDECAELNIPYLPARSTFIVDGRLRRVIAVRESSGAFADASHLVRGADGGRWDWPDMTSSALCVQIAVDGLHYSEAASVSVTMVPKVGVA